ncbi:MAG: threonine-phosphate decarboxylase [Selenomonadaceae bacterium]|nr:threonine-phosphate decarboxylase [Selenomonadaceae bacterium]
MQTYAHGGNIYAAVSPKGAWLDFSANINPLGLSAKVRDCLINNMAAVTAYPDPEAREFRGAVAEHFAVAYEKILPANGAAELFYLFFHTMKFRRVVIPVPTFSEYERAARAAGSRVNRLYLSAADNFTLEIGSLRQSLMTADCLVLANPDNPTGRLLPRENLLAIGDFAAANDKWLLIDESFLEFRPEAEELTARHLVREGFPLVVVHSLTKFYALPGLRLGFAVVPPSLAAKLNLHRDPWSVNVLAQKAGVVALHDLDYQEATRRYVAMEQKYLLSALGRLPNLKIFPPSVNFLLLSLADSPWRSNELVAAMQRENILLRDCQNYPGLDDTFIRLAVRRREENELLLRAWHELWRAKG